MEHRGILDLKIGGKIRQLKFGMNFWRLLSKEFNVEIEGLSAIMTKDFGIEGLLKIVFCALQSGTTANKEVIDYDINDVADWSDEFEEDTIVKITEIMAKSRILGNSMNMGLSRAVVKSSKDTKEAAA